MEKFASCSFSNSIENCSASTRDVSDMAEASTNVFMIEYYVAEYDLSGEGTAEYRSSNFSVIAKADSAVIERFKRSLRSTEESVSA